MICETCTNKEICKHYDYAIKNTGVSIRIDDCVHMKLSTKGLTTAHYDFSVFDHDYKKTLTPNSYPSVDQGVAFLNRHTSAQNPMKYNTRVTNAVKAKDFSRDLRELSNQVNNDRVNESFKVTSVPTELAKCDNPDCEADVYEEDKTNCSVCGKSVCPVCSYTDMHELNSIGDSIDSTNTIKTICEDCQKKKEDIPKPKKPKRKKTSNQDKDKKEDKPFGIDIFGGENNE